MEALCKLVHLGPQLSIPLEPLSVIRRLFFPTVVFSTIQPDPPPIRILLRKLASNHLRTTKDIQVSIPQRQSTTPSNPSKQANAVSRRHPATAPTAITLSDLPLRALEDPSCGRRALWQRSHAVRGRARQPSRAFRRLRRSEYRRAGSDRGCLRGGHRGRAHT